MVGDDPGIVADEVALEVFAYCLVEVEDVVGGDAVSVGRIGYHDGLVDGLLKLVEVALLYADDIFDACIGYIVQSYLDGLAIDVVAIYLMVEIALLAVVVVYSVEEVGIEVLPLLEGILFAEDPRIHIEGYEGCLDDDSA